MKTTFANPDDILNFTLTIEPDEGPATLAQAFLERETDM
jgi:hypothetical protein